MNKRIRVNIVIGSLGRGGAEGQVRQMLAHLDPTLFEPSLTVFADQEDPPSGLGSVCNLGIAGGRKGSAATRALRAAKGARKLAAHFRALQPDIVHAFLPASCVMAVAARRFAPFPVLIGSRRSLAGAYRNDNVIALTDRFATRRCDFLIGNSEAVTRELLSIDGIDEHRTATIYNGVDTRRFSPGDAPAVRGRYGWREGDVVFGTVANFFAYKRHCDFVAAAAYIYRECSSARFVLVGEDCGELATVRSQVQASGLEHVITIIPGIADPADLYRAMDVYVCSSATEGFSNVLLEAMACAKPLIATDVGGNAEAVTHGVTGLIVAPLRPEQLAQAAIAMAHSPDFRRRMGHAGRKRVEQQFSTEHMIRAHQELYIRLDEKSPVLSRNTTTLSA